MKKLIIAFLCLLLVGLCACGQVVVQPQEVLTTALFGAETTTKTNAPRLSPAEIKELESGPYADVLNPLVESNITYYALYDIDGNGIQELLLGESYADEIRLNSICTIKNGVAARQEEFFPFGEGGYVAPSTLFKNGTIRTGGINYEEILTYDYYRFEDGELKCQARIIDQSVVLQAWLAAGEDASEYPGGLYLRVNHPGDTTGTPITKEEFDRVQKEMEGDGQVVALNWRPLSEYEQSRKD